LLSGDPPLDAILAALGEGDAAPLSKLFTWVPVLDAAVQGLESPLYGAVFELLRALLVDHATELGLAPLEWALPPSGDLLADPRTGLADLARALALPSRAGLLWTQRALQRVAVRAGIPTGFGVRWQVIENLLVGGARFDRLGVLHTAVEEEITRTETCLARWADAPIAPWRSRLSQTRALLATISASSPSRTG
jgi:hypothetical protein